MTLMTMMYESVLLTCLEDSSSSQDAKHMGWYNDLMTMMCERVLPTCCLKDSFVVKNYRHLGDAMTRVTMVDVWYIYPDDNDVL